ncbi:MULTISPECIES: hypothetical protein [Klebsiella pneumoniae complex]|jgi:hypothetical protein|nr:hypothetical protein [Klebsiella variicola]HBS6018428.1 hypothetical protein [Klebsiella pneumoniae]KAA0474893.1 hypothetical protein F0331_01145 [Klebsiella variicola]HBQ5120518.1 hypothetical protein [Klebsiella variicola]HCD3048792.1 hypothetical protein [Klebsiella variicola]HCI9591166.1 hypothetical protein [Klebsiella variicola]
MKTITLKTKMKASNTTIEIVVALDKEMDLYEVSRNLVTPKETRYLDDDCIEMCGFDNVEYRNLLEEILPNVEVLLRTDGDIDAFNEELIETLTNNKLPKDYIKMFKE